MQVENPQAALPNESKPSDDGWGVVLPFEEAINDTHRPLMALESIFIHVNTITFQLGMISDADIPRLQRAYEQFNEWYPLLGLRLRIEPDRTYFQPGTIPPMDFMADLDRNPSIKDIKELFRIIMKRLEIVTKSGDPLYSAHLFPIDQEASKSCPFLRGEFKYITILYTHHALCDAMSLSIISRSVNTLYRDPTWKPPIPCPQKTPFTIPMLLRPETRPTGPAPLPRTVAPYKRVLNWDEKNPIPIADRSPLIAGMRLDPGELRRSKKYKLTSSMQGVVSFLYSALYFHQNPDLDELQSDFSLILRPDLKDFQPFPYGEEAYTYTYGMRAQSIPRKIIVRRGETLNDLMDDMERIRGDTSAGDMIKNTWTQKARIPDTREVSETVIWGHALMSNIGVMDIGEGPIKSEYLCSTTRQNHGNLVISSNTIRGGSTYIAAWSIRECHSVEFLDAFLKAWLMTMQRLADTDSTGFDTSSVLETPEMVRCLEALKTRDREWPRE